MIDAEGFNCFSPLFVSFASSFRVPFLGVLGKVITPSEIKAHLKYILDDPTPANEFPVGIMTSQDRDVWAATRRKLVEERKEETFVFACSRSKNVHINHMKIREPYFQLETTLFSTRSTAQRSRSSSMTSRRTTPSRFRSTSCTAWTAATGGSTSASRSSSAETGSHA